MATLQEYYNQLNTIYDPQRALLQQQQAALPEQYNAQLSSLEQAKINAFKDISNTASRRGMTWSGFSPEQQATYIGEKYLPAVANVKAAQTSAQQSLIDALNKINAQQGSQAQEYYQSEQNALADAEAKRYAAEVAAQAKLQAAQIKASTGSSTKQSQAEIKAALQTSLNQDIAQLFQGYNKNKQKGYTENVVLKQLISLYPELNAKDISSAVYNYRKIALGE